MLLPPVRIHHLYVRFDIAQDTLDNCLQLRRIPVFFGQSRKLVQGNAHIVLYGVSYTQRE